ncbi:MAG: ADP-ribosylglycohydrolase family protein [Pseudonocardiaceae bacterium]
MVPRTRAFLQTLAAAAGSIRGIGPSTTRAIKHFQTTGELPTSGGTTNGAPMLAAACVIAACASWALEGASGRLLLTAAINEEAQARSACAASDRLGVMLASLAAATWQPPAHGISLDPAETVTAALACTLRASSLRDGLHHAVGMGGDTDTVAAITGGLLGARLTVPDVLTELPWHTAVLLPDAMLVTETSSALAAVRASAKP